MIVVQLLLYEMKLILLIHVHQNKYSMLVVVYILFYDHFIEQLLESICRVSTLRGKNKAKFRDIRISNVPDRGGRVVVSCADDLKDSRDTRCYRVNVRDMDR